MDGKEGGVTVGRTHREAPEIDGVVRFVAAEGAGAGRRHDRDRPRWSRRVGPDLVVEAA